MKQLKYLWYRIGVILFGDFFLRAFKNKIHQYRQRKIEKATIARMKKRGLQVFEIDGKKAIARNKKNAERKVRNSSLK